MPRNSKKIRREILINGEKVWLTADSEQEYAEKLMRISAGISPKNDVFFSDYAQKWFDLYAEPNLARVTAVNYRRELRNHINPVIGHKKLREITPEDVQSVFNQMGVWVKQETKNKTRNVMNQIFKMAVDDKLIDYNPMNSSRLKIKGAPSTPTEPYSIAEMQYMVSHLEDLTSPEDRAWLGLSLSVPLRPEEVLGLRWQDVDTDNAVIHVCSTVTHPTRNEPEFKEYTKTAASVRYLSVPRRVIKLLPERGEETDFVVGGKSPISYTKLRAMVQRIAKQINFPTGITPRRFRTTVATDISDTTHDLTLVQSMLGHATPQMTLKHYVKGRNQAIDAANAISQRYGLD